MSGFRPEQVLARMRALGDSVLALIRPSKMQPPRVLLIGTSNAVFADGYAHSLRNSPYFSAFDNRSIGLSSSFLFTYQSNSIDFAGFDFCILDLCCNDASLFESGYLDRAAIEAQMHEAISIISMSGCIPVVLILPITRALPSGDPVRAIYRDICATHKVAFLDCYELFERLQVKFAKDVLFLDSMHITLPFARAVGSLLATAIQSLWERRKRRNAVQWIDGYAHRLMPASELSGQGATRTRSTRLLSAECLDIGPGRTSVSVRAGDEVVAFAANVSFSNCHLTIRGLNAIDVRLSTEHYDCMDMSFVLGIWPLNPAVKELNATIELLVEHDRLGGVSVGWGPVVDGPGSASLAGLLLRSPTKLPWTSFFDRAINLADCVDTAFIASAVESCQIGFQEAIADALYRGVLDRPGDKGGLQLYASVIDERGVRAGIPAVLASMLNSEEYKRKNLTHEQ